MSLQDCDAVSSFEFVDTSLTVDGVAFSATTVTQAQSAGYDIALPALKADWLTSTNPYVTGIQFEYTPTSFAGQTKLTAPQRIAALSWVTTDGIMPEGVYDCRWRAVGQAAYGPWSAVTSITILDGFSGLAGADGVLSSQDLYTFLWTIKTNLDRFDAYVLSNGAAAVDPYTAHGSQQEAITIPGGASAIFVTRTATRGLANRDGAAYNQQFLAWVDSGTATLRAGFRDASNAAITGLADRTFALTTTPTVCSWTNIHSDDPDFETNSKFELFTNSTTDIPSGRTVFVTDLMNETDDFFAPHGLTTPWRPSPDEDNLLRYAALLTVLFKAARTASPGQRRQVNAEGTGEEYAPLGPRTIRKVTDADTTLRLADSGGYVRMSSASPHTVTVPKNATAAFPVKTSIALRQIGAGTVTVAGDTGVTVNPKFGGSLALAGQYDLVQLVKVDTDEWDMI